MIGAVVMAAGSSQRFGSDKRLYRVSGESGEGALLQQTLSHVLALCIPTVVMLRSQDQTNIATLLGQDALHANLLVGYVANPEDGLGHSIAQCFKALPKWDGALLFLGDMPRIKETTGQQLIKQFSTARIQVPTYQGKRGHPVLFPRRFFKDLAKLHGDSGAKDLLQRESDLVDEYAVDDPGILWDLDEPPQT